MIIIQLCNGTIHQHQQVHRQHKLVLAHQHQLVTLLATVKQ